MADSARPIRRAFITCAARAVSPAGRLMDEVERVLLEAGWRTRLPGRLEADAETSLDERRRLARTARGEVERASVLIHVPAPANLSGTTVHRELAHALKCGVPVLLVVARAQRAGLGVGMPDPARLAYLVERTGARVVDDLATLADDAAAVARPLAD